MQLRRGCSVRFFRRCSRNDCRSGLGFLDLIGVGRIEGAVSRNEVVNLLRSGIESRDQIGVPTGNIRVIAQAADDVLKCVDVGDAQLYTRLSASISFFFWLGVIPSMTWQ